MLSSSVILSALLSTSLPPHNPFFRSQVLPPFIQLLPILLDLAWHTTSSGELSRSFQTLSTGSLHSGTVHCPLGDTCPPHSAQGMLFNGRILSPLPIHKHTSILQSGPHSSCSLNAGEIKLRPREGRKIIQHFFSHLPDGGGEALTQAWPRTVETARDRLEPGNHLCPHLTV